MKRYPLLLLLIGFSLQNSRAQKIEKAAIQVDRDKLPVPNEKEQLFYIQRDPDANTVVYSLNKKGDKLDETRPVNVYWIRYEEDGEHKDLSFIQRKFAYGIHHRKINDNEYEIYLTSFKRLLFRLAYCPEIKEYKAYTSINNEETIVNQIFVRINGGSLFKPNVDYIEIAGNERKTGKAVSHRIEL